MRVHSDVTPPELERILREPDACNDARKIIRPSDTPAAAWERWRDPAQLLWAAARVGVDRAVVIAAAADCVSLIAKSQGKTWAVEMAAAFHAWTRGETTTREVCILYSSLRGGIPHYEGTGMDTTVSEILSCLEHPGCISNPAHDALLYERTLYNPGELADVVRARIPFPVVEKAYAEFSQELVYAKAAKSAETLDAVE